MQRGSKIPSGFKHRFKCVIIIFLGMIDVCDQIDCGIGQCSATSSNTFQCLCPDGTTQQEPCKEPSGECGGTLAGELEFIQLFCRMVLLS